MGQPQWMVHANVGHVLYTSTNSRGTLMLHFHCKLCGDTTNWQCSGEHGMPAYRLALYCNEHLHGQAPPQQAIHPRHLRGRR